MEINEFKALVYISLTSGNKELLSSSKDSVDVKESSNLASSSTSSSNSSKDNVEESTTSTDESATSNMKSKGTSEETIVDIQKKRLAALSSYSLSKLSQENRKLIEELNDKQKMNGLRWIELDIDDNGNFNDPIVLKRFFIGHNQKIDASFKALFECIKWRHDFGADSIISEWEASALKDPKIKLLHNTFPVGLLNVQHDGRPIFLYRFPLVDFARYFELCGLDLLMRLTVYYLEKICEAATKTGDAIMIMDIGYTKGIDVEPPIKSFWEVQSYISYLMKYLNPLTKIADPYYPETNHVIIFTRAPTLFWGVWKVISLLIAERTKQKVVVYTSDKPKDDLLKHLPIAMIPDVLGGEASTAHFPRGGSIAKDALEKI